MTDEITAGAAEIIEVGNKLVNLTGYLHSIHVAIADAIDALGDDEVAHRLMLARATLAQVGKAIDVIGGQLSQGARYGVFDNLQLD